MPLAALLFLTAAEPVGISLAPLQRQETISSEEAAELRRVLVDLISRTPGIDAKEVALTDLLAGKGPRFTLSGKIYRLDEKLVLDVSVADRKSPDEPRGAVCSGPTLLTLVNSCQDLVLRLFPELRPKEKSPTQVVVRETTIQQGFQWQQHHVLYATGLSALIGSVVAFALAPSDTDLADARTRYLTSPDQQSADGNYFRLQQASRDYAAWRRGSLGLLLTSSGLFTWGLMQQNRSKTP